MIIATAGAILPTASFAQGVSPGIYKGTIQGTGQACSLNVGPGEVKGGVGDYNYFSQEAIMTPADNGLTTSGDYPELVGTSLFEASIYGGASFWFPQYFNNGRTFYNKTLDRQVKLSALVTLTGNGWVYTFKEDILAFRPNGTSFVEETKTRTVVCQQ